MTKTSSPRTFSRISTKISLSEKRRMFALTSGKASLAAMASASGLLLLPVRIFMVKPLISKEKRPPPAATRAEHISRPQSCKPPETSRFLCPPAAHNSASALSGRRFAVDHDDAVQAADVSPFVPFAGAVHRAAIVRHQHVARLPAVAVTEAVLDHVLQQLVVERLRPLALQAIDAGAPFAAEIEAALAELGMGADQRMDDVGDLAPLGLHLRRRRLGKEVLEQPRAAVQHLQVLDLGALAGRQRLVGGDAVGVARVALAGRHLDG